MRSVAKEVKKALNENEEQYYIWYSNWEDGITHDMTEDEIYSYQFGWCETGPFSTMSQAENQLKAIINKEIMQYFYEFEDEFLGYWWDANDDSDNYTETDKIEYLQRYLDYKSSTNVTFGENVPGFNTCEWEIITKEEKDRRDNLPNNTGSLDNNDNDDKYYIIELEKDGYDKNDPGMSHSAHYGPYNSLDEANNNVKTIKKRVMDIITQQYIDDGEKPDMNYIRNMYFYKVVSEEKLKKMIGYLYNSIEEIRKSA